MRNKILLILCLFLLSTVLAGCREEVVEESKTTLVKTEVVKLGTSMEKSSYAGTVRGRYETNMAFQVGGQIINRSVQLGDRVNAGDVLMTIDAKDIVQKSNQSDAQVTAAKAQLDLAQTNLNRYRELYNQSAIPASALDQYQTNYDAALASYNNAVALSAQGHNAVSYTELIANNSGVISSINAEAGQVVAAGQTVMTLIQTDELEVEINIPENHLPYVSIGKPVEIELWAIKDTNGKKLAGIVREIAPIADSVARTYKVRVSISNPPADVKLGMTANVIIAQENTNDEKIAVLPMSAIYQTGSKPQVWLVDKDNMTLYLKDISTEIADNNKVKVSGLANGDIVVTAGVHKLMEGQKVHLSEANIK